MPVSGREQLLELLEVDEVAPHFLPREVVEQAQHALEQDTVLATAQLLGKRCCPHPVARQLATGEVERNREC